jgi:hypothetical protein
VFNTKSRVIMKKELIIYLSVILVVALAWHNKQWLDHPVEHLLGLPHGGAFGVPGIIHPFVFGLGIYLLLWMPRLIIMLFTKKG